MQEVQQKTGQNKLDQSNESNKLQKESGGWRDSGALRGYLNGIELENQTDSGNLSPTESLKFVIGNLNQVSNIDNKIKATSKQSL